MKPYKRITWVDPNLLPAHFATSSLNIHFVLVTIVKFLHADEKFSVPKLSEQNPVNSSQDLTDRKESLHSSTEPENESTEAEVNISSEATELWKNFVDSLILVCCEDSMLLYSTKSLIQVPLGFLSSSVLKFMLLRFIEV